MSTFSHPSIVKSLKRAQSFHPMQKWKHWIAWAQIMLLMADDVRFGNPRIP